MSRKEKKAARNRLLSSLINEDRSDSVNSVSGHVPDRQKVATPVSLCSSWSQYRPSSGANTGPYAFAVDGWSPTDRQEVLWGRNSARDEGHVGGGGGSSSNGDRVEELSAPLSGKKLGRCEKFSKPAAAHASMVPND